MLPDRPDEFAQVLESPWVDAPGDSHLEKFRLVNKAFADTTEPSELYVVFRARTNPRTGKHNPESEYVYKESDHQKLAVIFDRMSVHADPGELVWSELIRKGNKGEQIR